MHLLRYQVLLLNCHLLSALRRVASRLASALFLALTRIGLILVIDGVENLRDDHWLLALGPALRLWDHHTFTMLYCLHLVVVVQQLDF